MNIMLAEMGLHLCAVCRQGNDTDYTDQLIRIKNWLNTKGIKTYKKEALDNLRKVFPYDVFHHNYHCKHGIGGCSKMNSNNTNHRNVATEVSYLLITYLHNEDFSDVHSLLRLLRGYYPREYKAVEKKYYEYKKRS